MSVAESTPSARHPPPEASRAEFAAELARLRRLDNHSNWRYLAQTWLYLVVVIVAAVAFVEFRSSARLAWWWDVPVVAVAVVLIGAGQHQLAGATHEATHHILFKNRWLNELASDLLCMYPLFSSTYHFRLHHLAHHNYVNDPVRDPDFAQLAASGHAYDFPMEKQAFVWAVIRNLWPPKLARYIYERVKINSLGEAGVAYSKQTTPQRNGVGPAIAFVAALAAVAIVGSRVASPWPLAVGPLVVWSAAAAYLLARPSKSFLQNRLRPVIPHRVSALLRATFMTLLVSAIGWGNRLSGAWVGGYFLLLWGAPILTSFAFFMILRQVIQHGNGDRGRLTNTRIFYVHPFIRWAVFPYGMDIHLPHHLYATVPHYRLPQLHDLLLRQPEYAERGQIVEGYFLPRRRGQVAPTALEVIGPRYAQTGDEVYIDDDVLQYDAVEPVDS